ncbi:lipopolysaccharide export system permease protein [Palleronia aestuarii]|uniref:Lipopolysaccharide export system permease protein n=1 Tax=Palleronia aestuarii TaxID=568105 RepID=A0A2W7NLF1_9RHOB|nr:LPS export ABC transporter permease LptF [Palleronia aestuarii]PZX17504.1 lipopolysaccharide export system permease protein [Palleronia aestuarii]
MGRLDRYLLAQFLTLFGFFSLVLVLVYWVNRAVVLFDRLIAGGHSALVFLEFSVLSLPNVIRLVLPISAFAAAVYVANRMRGENELVVAQAAGLSPVRLARPALVFGLFCGVVVMTLSHVLVPLSLSRLGERTAEISEDVTAGLLTDGEFLHPADGVTLYIREITPQTELLGLFLSDTRVPGRSVVYTAESAVLARTEVGPRLVMFDGMIQRLTQPGRNLVTTRFDDFAFDIASLIDTMPQRSPDIDELPTLTLLGATDRVAAKTGEPRSRILYEANERVTQGLIAIVAPLIGFACMQLGGYTRFGAWRQIIGGICCVIAIDLADNLVADIARDDAALWPVTYLPPLIGLALAFGILVIAGGPAQRRPFAGSAPG